VFLWTLPQATDDRIMTRAVAIMGSGPIGLDAALAAAERGLDVTLYEAGEAVGAHVRRWGHVRTFTPWSMSVSPRARRALGQRAPAGPALPTGSELVERLLEPLAALPALRARLRLGTRVVAVGREGLLKHEAIGAPERALRKFRLLLVDRDGAESVVRADVVIDATGTYSHPNRLGDGGIAAVGEGACEDRIDRHLTPFAEEPGRWAGATVLLTGSGHSAQTAARELALFARDAPGTRVIWALRRSEADFGAIAGDPLPERAALNADAAALAAGASPAVEVRTGVVTEVLAPHDGRVAVTLRNGDDSELVADRILALNGSVGDASLYRQLQVHECYATCGPMKLAAALLGETGGDCLSIAPAGPDALANPEPGFFILGAKSYGRNSQFLMRTGWSQVDDVFGSLLGRPE